MTAPSLLDLGADYRCHEYHLLRVPARPLAFVEEVLAAVRADGEDRATPADPGVVPARTAALAADPTVRRALSIASPDLVDALDRLSEPTEGLSARRRRARAKQARRATSRTLRYLLRMASRPTPFGTFAGVAWSRFGEAGETGPTVAGVGPGRVRPDFGWVLDVVRRVEEDPAVRPWLPVRANDLLHVGPARVHLSQADTHGSGDRRSLNVRRTPPLTFALEMAAKSPSYAELCDALTARFDDEETSVVHGFVAQLWEQRILMSDLRPALSCARPDAELLARLEALPDVGDLPRLRDGLRVVSAACSRADGPDDGAVLGRIRATQLELTPGFSGPLLQVDAALETTDRPVLPGTVAADLEAAVAALTAVTRAAPPQNAHLAAYRSVFVERYGLNTLVPVLDVLDPRTGLGPPDTYLHPGRSWPLPASGTHRPADTSAYERVVGQWVTEAARRGEDVLELTDERLEELLTATRGRGDDEQVDPPVLPLIDAYAQVARDPLSGEWSVILRDDVITYGGRTFGRFHDVLDERAVGDLRDLAAQDAAARPDAVSASISYLPGSGHAANVTLVPRVRPYEVVLNVGASGHDDLRLDPVDLSVGATDTGFYLWSTRWDRRVTVHQGHMLNVLSAPDVARFLLEISDDGYLVPQGFSWLGLESHARLPRVVRGRTVLRPAQWTLDAGRVLGAHPPRSDESRAALAAWRERHAVPRWCHLVDEDNRLVLDLDEPALLDELADAAVSSHTRAVVVQEMLPAFGTGAVRGPGGLDHVTEIVVPMLDRRARPDDLEPVLEHGRIGDEVVRHVTGGRWTYLKVYADDHQQDALLAGDLPALVDDLVAAGAVDRWFFIRYLDPRPHLRLRLRAADEASVPHVLAAAVQRVHGWVGEGRANDLELAGFDAEVARYGGAEVYDAVEATFTASSEATTRLLPLLREHGGELDPDEVAVVLLVWLYTAWGYRPDQLLDVMPRGSESDVVRDRVRGARERLCSLVAPDLFAGGGAEVEGAAETRATVLAHLRVGEDLLACAGRAVREASEGGTLRGDEAGIVGSLAHMAVNRMWSVDRQRENDLYFLTHEVLRAVRGRLAARRAER